MGNGFSARVQHDQDAGTRRGAPEEIDIDFTFRWLLHTLMGVRTLGQSAKAGESGVCFLAMASGQTRTAVRLNLDGRRSKRSAGQIRVLR